MKKAWRGAALAMVLGLIALPAAAQNVRITPVGSHPGGVTTVPVAAPCRANTRLGGAFIAKIANAAQGVEITIVYASHANNPPLSLLSEQQRANVDSDGAGFALGPPTGYVVKF